MIALVFLTVLSDERLGAKLRVTENRSVIFNRSTYVYIHLFQKTLSERTANGSCRTEIARPKGTVVSIFAKKQ